MKSFFEYRESKHIELKEKLPSHSQIVKTCVAFANNGGGEIIIGVKNETLEIVGVSDYERDQIYESLANSIYDSIAPQIYPDIFERNINNKNIVTIKVYPGSNPPYFIKSEGTIKGVYLRIGSNTRRASQEYIDELYRSKKKITFDEEVSNCEFKLVNKNLLKDVYGTSSPSENKLLADKIIIRDERNPKKLMLTQMGVLYFTDQPDLYIHEALVICTEFKGKEGRNILRTEELRGSIPQLVEKTLNTIQSYLEKNYIVRRSGKLKGSVPIPLSALREAVINALIHRKYFIPGAIKIAIYEDHLELFSPGSFPGLISISNVGDGTTFLRNPNIARMARKFRLAEKMGTGVRLIFESCRNARLKRPSYNEDGDFVKLIFYFEKENPKNPFSEKILMSLLKQKQYVTVAEVMKTFSISRNTATRKLNKLIQDKKIVREGKGPATLFKFVGSN